MARPGRMYATPDTNGQVVKSLEPGTMLYPTGEKRDVPHHVTRARPASASGPPFREV
jgi:hypothetical protein